MRRLHIRWFAFQHVQEAPERLPTGQIQVDHNCIFTYFLMYAPAVDVSVPRSSRARPHMRDFVKLHSAEFTRGVVTA